MGSVNITKNLTADVIIDNIATFIILQDHLNSAVAAHAAAVISFDDTNVPWTATKVQVAVTEALTHFNNHVAANPAHAATAISVIPFGSIGAVEVQDAIEELETEIDLLNTNITVSQGSIDNHIADTTDAHAASAISFNNVASGLTAIEVQAAIDEIDNAATSGGGTGVVDYVRTSMTTTPTLLGTPGGGAFGPEVKLPFNTIVNGDDLSNFSTGSNQYVADRNMEVRVRAYIHATINNNQYLHLRIKVAGAEIRRAFTYKQASSANPADTTVEISTIVELTNTQIVEVFAFLQSFSSTASTTVDNNRAETGFEVEVLRDNTP